MEFLAIGVLVVVLIVAAVVFFKKEAPKVKLEVKDYFSKIKGEVENKADNVFDLIKHDDKQASSNNTPKN